jgi:hypothetical protein
MRGNQRKKRTYLTVQQKLTILDELKKGVPVKVLAHQYKVSDRALYRLRSQGSDFVKFGKRGGHLKQHKTRKRSWNDELENRLYSWIQDQQATGNPLSDILIQEKALEFSEGQASTSSFGSIEWYEGFIHRYGIDESQIRKELTTAKRRRLAEGETAASAADISTESFKAEDIDIEDTILEWNADVESFVGTHIHNIKIETVTGGVITEGDTSTEILTEGNIDVGGSIGTHSQNIKIEREELSLIEKKRADLIRFQEIIRKYANNNQAVLIMGEALTRILKMEKPEI